ncbi:HsdM family class I SAM-dependent methyltransferase [Aneurinibacillus tyrosinisolvens]|uniref:HsdM family class I SAM-dependent methyltransferase n=1 Tax=Aneurinibacillus tyrosinisolvens TaxID=1443435 RepID=UPI00063EE0E6|nr:N-6 DNA methylase [Aneurinibacillus tyrosinisolvens]
MGRKERKRYEDNARALELIKKETELTAEEIQYLKESYTGVGGLTSSAWANGQFFTPQPVARFVIDMLDIKEGKVLEPSAGAGAFLNPLPDTCEVTAVELMHDAYTVTKKCYPHANVIQGDFLEMDFTGQKFRYIIGNPPYGLKVDYEYEYGKNFKSEVAFIDKCLRLLEPGGILAMVVPDSILNTSREKPFRQYVMERYRYLGTVSLPPETFAHVGTSVSTSVMMIQHDDMTPEQRGDYSIFMAQCEKVGWTRRLAACESDLPAILEAYREFRHQNQVSVPAVVEEKNNVIPLPIPQEPEPQLMEENGQFLLFG